MADINSLSFGCGNTLLANQLNIMADAIRSLITLVENIDDQVGSYIPLSGSEKITGVLAPKTHEGYDLGKSTNRWGTVWASTGGFKTIDFYDLQTPYGKLGELYIGKDTSNNNETILQFKHGNNNEEIVATREWVENQKSIKIRNSDNTLLGTISSVGTLNSGLFLQIETNTSNPILLNNYNDDTGYCAGILFSDSDSGSGTISGNVLTVHNGNIYIDGDLYGAGGENGVSVLNDLSNVDASAARTGWFLMYNGTGWVSSPLPESLIIHPSDVSNNEEYYLKYEVDDEHPSGWYSWVERQPGAKELNELNDVEINDTDLGLGQVLVYSQVTDEENNTYNSWVNKTLSGSLTYDQSDSNKYLKVKSDGNGTEWSDISLSDLSNTEIGGSNNALSNGLVLVYDSSSTKWKNASLPTGNLPSTTDRAVGDYLVLKDDNGTLKAGWTNVTSNITDVIDNGMVDSVAGGTYYRNYKLKTSGGTTTGTGININTLPPSVDSQDNILTFKNGFVLNGTNGASIIFPNILSTNKISLVNTAASGNTGSGKIAYLEYNGNNINIDTYTSISTQNHETAGTAKLYLNGTEIGTGGSGLTGIKYQNSSDSNATIASSSSGYITLKAGTSNVSFDNTTTGVLKISVSGNSNLTPATDIALGGIQIGYAQNNKNYPVLLDTNNKAYVNVPWTASGLTSGNWANYLNGQQKDTLNLSSGYLYYTSGTDSLSIMSSSPGSGVTSITPGTGLLNHSTNNKLAITNTGTIDIDQSVVINNSSLANLLDALFVSTNNVITGVYDITDQQFKFTVSSELTSSNGTFYFYIKGNITGYVNPIFKIEGGTGIIKPLCNYTQGSNLGQSEYWSFPDNEYTSERKPRRTYMQSYTIHQVADSVIATSDYSTLFSGFNTNGTYYPISLTDINNIFGNGEIKYYLLASKIRLLLLT